VWVFVPGDEELFVGGGALNGAVGQVLFEAHKTAENGMGWRTQKSSSIFGRSSITIEKDQENIPVFEKDSCQYAKLHKRLHGAACSSVGRVVEEDNINDKEDTPNIPVVRSCARVFTGSREPFGAVFLHELKEGCRPISSQNSALLYTVGVLGQNAKAPGEGTPKPERARMVKGKLQFVQYLYKTGINTLEVVKEYNLKNPGMAVTRLRVPIVSGGTFKHPEVGAEVCALALLAGMQAVSYDEGELTIELMPSQAMTEAFELIRTDKDKKKRVSTGKDIREVLKDPALKKEQKDCFKHVVQPPFTLCAWCCN